MHERLLETHALIRQQSLKVVFALMLEKLTYQLYLQETAEYLAYPHLVLITSSKLFEDVKN